MAPNQSVERSVIALAGENLLVSLDEGGMAIVRRSPGGDAGPHRLHLPWLALRHDPLD